MFGFLYIEKLRRDFLLCDEIQSASRRNALLPPMNTPGLPLAQVSDLAPGERKVFSSPDDGVGIGLFRLLDGSFRAYRDFCPHAGAPLCEGGDVRQVPATAPDPAAVAAPREVLRCPWHGWEFDLATGRHVRAAACALESLPVAVADGTVFVILPPAS